MKKFKMSTSIIIIVVSVAIIVGIFYFFLQHFSKDDENDVTITEVQNILLRDMEKDYPPTPKEVLKYYSSITQCFYAGGYTEEELKQLADRALELYDEELVEHQDYDVYLKNLKSEIQDYKDKKWTISSYSTSSSVDVLEFEKDGDQWAQLYAFYNIRQSNKIVKTTERFLMRKDKQGHWKIFGWQQGVALE